MGRNIASLFFYLSFQHHIPQRSVNQFTPMDLPYISPDDVYIDDLFPSLTPEERAAKKEFLLGYFEIAYQIFERLEREREDKTQKLN